MLSGQVGLNVYMAQEKRKVSRPLCVLMMLPSVGKPVCEQSPIQGLVPRDDETRQREGKNGRRQKKLIGLTDLIGQLTNILSSFH